MTKELLDRIAVTQQKAIGDEHTSSVVMFMPSEVDAVALQLDYDDETAERWDELHVTMAYLGKAVAISEADKMLLMRMVGVIAKETEPIVARSFAVNVFNPKGEDPCLVVGIGGDAMVEPRKKIWEILTKMERMPIPDNHEPWIPHITLKYFKDKKIDWKLVARVASNLPETVLLDRIRVAYGNGFVDFPLTGKKVDETVPEPEETSETKPVSAYEKADNKLGKCRYCKAKATKKIGIDGGAWMGTCDEHEEQGRRDADGEGLEEKVVRHVRTPAGQRRFGQPIGSVIVRDGIPLKNLKITGDSEYDGWVKVRGKNGKDYEVGKEDGKWYATGAEGGWDDIAAEADTEEALYQKLDKMIGTTGKINAGEGGKAPKHPKPYDNFTREDSEYEGYEKYSAPDGTAIYRETSTNRYYDENDNELSDVKLRTLNESKLKGNTGPKIGDSEPKKPSDFDARVEALEKYTVNGPDYVRAIADNLRTARRMATEKRWDEAQYWLKEAEDSAHKFAPKKPVVSGNAGFKKVKSEYDGYDQYEGDNGKKLWTEEDGSKYNILDEDDNVVESVGSNELSAALSRLLKREDSESKPKAPLTKKPVESAPKTTPKKVERPYKDQNAAIAAAKENPAEFVRKMSDWLFQDDHKNTKFDKANMMRVAERIDSGELDQETAARDIRGWSKLGTTISRGRLNQIAAGLEYAGKPTPKAVAGNSNTSALIDLRGAQSGLPERHPARLALRNAYNSVFSKRKIPEQVAQELRKRAQDDDVKPYGPALVNVADKLSKGKNTTNSNGSKIGPGGQGHIPSDPDKVELTKPKDLGPGMMVNVGEGGWKYIGQVQKTTRTTGWGGRGGIGSLEGQYTIFDPWGEPIAIMSPNHTVEVDTNVPQRNDMQPKIRRNRNFHTREVETTVEPAPGVAGQANPFEDNYPDFDPNSQKIYGTPVRYEFRTTDEDILNSNGIRTGARLPATTAIVRRTRNSNGGWDESVVRSQTHTGTRLERDETVHKFRLGFNEFVAEERAKAGVSNYKPWTVPSQRRAPKAKPAPNTTSASRVSGVDAPKPVLSFAERKKSVRQAYTDLIKSKGRKPGEPIRFADLREALPNISREDLDAALIEMDRDSDVYIFAEMNQKTMTERDRAAALSIGNRPAHYIQISSPTSDAVPTTTTSVGGIYDYELTKPKSRLPTAEEQAAAAKVVQKTQEGRDLRRGVVAYQQKSGEVRVLQDQWMKTIARGESTGNPKRDAELRAMSKAIREAPNDDRDLYRGFSIGTDVDVNEWLGTTQVLPISSFSSDRSIARSFRGATLAQGRRRVNVTLKGGPSRRALPVEVFGTPKYAYEREWITAGGFKVTKVELRQGHWHIEMEQTGVFDERNV